MRKRRTRSHVIADLGANHVEKHALRCGYPVHNPLTYADLDSLLHHLGFASVTSTGAQRVYENALRGAVVVLPPWEADAPVRPHHLAAVRRIVVEKGVAEEADFDRLMGDRQLAEA